MKRDAVLFFLTTTQLFRSWNDPNHWECLLRTYHSSPRKVRNEAIDRLLITSS